MGKIESAYFQFQQYSSRYDKFKAGIIENAFNPEIKNSALADIGVYPLHLALRLFGKPSAIDAKSLFLENGFEAEGTLILHYPEFDAKISYSKIFESDNVSSIAAENAYVEFGKINAPQNLKIIIDGIDYGESYVAEENNMRAEINAFCDAVLHGTCTERLLDITEATLEAMHEVQSAVGIK